MNTFNMKQWLQENKVGPYNKSALNEAEEPNKYKNYPEEELVEEDEFQIDGEYYLANYIVHYDTSYDYRAQEFDIDLEVELKSLYKAEGDEYKETTDPSILQKASLYLNSNEKKDKIAGQLELPDPGDDESDLDDDSWMNEKKNF